MKLTTLPYNFTADSLMPIAYYPYTSSTVDRIVDVNVWNRRDDPTLQDDIKPFLDIKKKCMATLLDCSSAQDGSEMRLNQWDNKVVLCLQTTQGNLVYIGYYDNNWTMGFGVSSDKWVKPQKYKHRNLVKRGGEMIDMDHWKCDCKKNNIHPDAHHICTKCSRKKISSIIYMPDVFSENPKVYEVEAKNMFLENDMFLGTYSREALHSLVREAFLSNYEDVNVALLAYEHNLIWLKEQGVEQEEWLLELANLLKSANMVRKDIFSWITISFDNV